MRAAFHFSLFPSMRSSSASLQGICSPYTLQTSHPPLSAHAFSCRDSQELLRKPVPESCYLLRLSNRLLKDPKWLILCDVAVPRPALELSCGYLGSLYDHHSETRFRKPRIHPAGFSKNLLQVVIIGLKKENFENLLEESKKFTFPRRQVEVGEAWMSSVLQRGPRRPQHIPPGEFKN